MRRGVAGCSSSGNKLLNNLLFFPGCDILHTLRWCTFFSISILPGQIINSYLLPVLPSCSFPLLYILFADAVLACCLQCNTLRLSQNESAHPTIRAWQIIAETNSMHAIRQKCRPKHQVLILKCYPRTTKGAVDVKPNSSELSYLLYYATTRRSKVQKVGAFLEKKTASDVWRARIGYVYIRSVNSCDS